MASHTGPRAGTPAHRVMCHLVEKGGSADIAALKSLVEFDGVAGRNFRERVTQVLQNYEYATVRDTTFTATDAGKEYVARMTDSVRIAEKYVGQIAAPRVAPPARPLDIAKHFPALPVRDGAFSYRDIPSLMGGKRVLPNGGSGN